MAFLVVSIGQIFSDSTVLPISRGGYICYAIFISTVLICIFRNSGRLSALIVFITFGWVLTYCFTSDNRNLFLGFDATGALVIFCAAYVMSSLQCKISDSDRLNRINPKITCLKQVFSVVLFTAGVMCFYGYVYRDEPVDILNNRVKTGIFAGLYTTEDTSRYVQQLESEIIQAIDPGTTLFLANNMPSIYLMSKSKVLAPQTWDAQFLNRGYTSAEPVLSYFDYKNDIPDVIVADNHLFTQLYDNEGIEIWQFIKENYILQYEFDHEQNGLTRIWKRKGNN